MTDDNSPRIFFGKLGVDSAHSIEEFRVQVWQRSDPGAYAEYRETFSDPEWLDQDWTFAITNHTGTVHFDNYQENAANALGLRTEMSDASGTTAWDYDAFGRLTQETRTITDQGIFVTQWGGFDSAGRVGWMRYPGGPAGQVGEKVAYAYLPQSAVENIFSASNRYYYLQLAQYDDAGRVDKIHLGAPNLGSEPVLKTDYDYFAWNVPNGVGRLRSITTGTPANPTSLQNTQYYLGNVSKYDPVGNLTAIYEYGSGNPRT